MADNSKNFWDNIYLRAIIVVLGIIALSWVLGKTQLAWSSFLIAFLVAYLVNPFLLWLKHKRIPRSLGIVLIMVAIIFLSFLAILLLSSVLIALVELPIKLSQVLTSLPSWYENSAPDWFINRITDNQEELDSLLASTWANFLAWLQGNISGVINRILTGTAGFFQGFLSFFILLVFIAFTMGSYPIIGKALIDVFPERHKPFAKDLAQKLDFAVGGYVRAKILEAFIMFFVSSTVLGLLGVPNALALGLINALLNPLPYAGPFLATIIESLVALTVSWQLALIVLIVMFIIEQIDGSVMGPLLLSKTVKVHPVLILSALIVGGALFGFWGILLAIPTTAFLQLLYQDYYQASSWYKQPPE